MAGVMRGGAVSGGGLPVPELQMHPHTLEPFSAAFLACIKIGHEPWFSELDSVFQIKCGKKEAVFCRW